MNSRIDMNKMTSILAIFCGVLAACSRSESAPAGPGAPTTPNEPVVTTLTAPKDGLTTNLDALESLTFWWKPAEGEIDGYELAFFAEGSDPATPAATFSAGIKAELTPHPQRIENPV